MHEVFQWISIGGVAITLSASVFLFFSDRQKERDHKTELVRIQKEQEKQAQDHETEIRRIQDEQDSIVRKHNIAMKSLQIELEREKQKTSEREFNLYALKKLGGILRSEKEKNKLKEELVEKTKAEIIILFEENDLETNEVANNIYLVFSELNWDIDKPTTGKIKHDETYPLHYDEFQFGGHRILYIVANDITQDKNKVHVGVQAVIDAFYKSGHWIYLVDNKSYRVIDELPDSRMVIGVNSRSSHREYFQN